MYPPLVVCWERIGLKQLDRDTNRQTDLTSEVGELPWHGPRARTRVCARHSACMALPSQSVLPSVPEQHGFILPTCFVFLRQPRPPVGTKTLIQSDCHYGHASPGCYSLCLLVLNIWPFQVFYWNCLRAEKVTSVESRTCERPLKCSVRSPHSLHQLRHRVD